MAVAKPKGGAGLYAKGVLDKIFRERTGKETKTVKRELLGEVAMGLIPGGGLPSRIGKQEAARGVVRGYLKLLKGLYTRKEALQAARPQVRAIAKTPQEVLDLVDVLEPKYLPKHTRASFGEFVLKKDYDAAVAAGRPVTSLPTKSRRIYLDPIKAEPTSFYHEAGHVAQRTTRDSAIKKMLGPLRKEFEEGVSGKYGSLAEQHARDFAGDMLSMSELIAPRRGFTAEEFNEVLKRSLESTLKKRGWVP